MAQIDAKLAEQKQIVVLLQQQQTAAAKAASEISKTPFFYSLSTEILLLSNL
jgi:hypothetical protein